MFDQKRFMLVRIRRVREHLRCATCIGDAIAAQHRLERLQARYNAMQ